MLTMTVVDVIADVCTVGIDDHAALMDSETNVEVVTSLGAAVGVAANDHIPTRTDDDTIVVEYNISDGST